MRYIDIIRFNGEIETYQLEDFVAYHEYGCNFYDQTTHGPYRLTEAHGTGSSYFFVFSADTNGTSVSLKDVKTIRIGKKVQMGTYESICFIEEE